MKHSTLRVGTWNILGRRRNKQLRPVDDGAVMGILDRYPVDVLCLQEVHFYNGQADSQLRYELKMSGLPYFVGKPLSPSHLDSQAQLGICIAARFPLSQPQVYTLNNPGLTAQVRGQEWNLHDKGAIHAELFLDCDRRVKILSLHLFPFFEFGVNDDENKHVTEMWRELWRYADCVGHETEVILAGDYNQARRADAARRWSSVNWRFCVPGRVTTTSGLSLDDIAINWPSPPADPKVVPTFSDHHLVIVELVLPSPTAPAWSVPTRRVGNVIRSDLD